MYSVWGKISLNHMYYKEVDTSIHQQVPILYNIKRNTFFMYVHLLSVKEKSIQGVLYMPQKKENFIFQMPYIIKKRYIYVHMSCMLAICFGHLSKKKLRYEKFR